MTRLPQRLHQRLAALDARGEDGMVTAFVVVLTMALILMAGLVIDGGLTLAAKIRAIDDAQAAARAAAQQIDLATYRSTGQVVLSPGPAASAAQAYLTAATGHPGTVTVTGDRVSVTVSVTQRTQVLSVAGLGSLTVTGTGAATALHGVTGPGT